VFECHWLVCVGNDVERREFIIGFIIGVAERAVGKGKQLNTNLQKNKRSQKLSKQPNTNPPKNKRSQEGGKRTITSQTQLKPERAPAGSRP